MELLDILAILGAVSMFLALVSMILYFARPRNKNMYLTGMFTLVGISVVLWIIYFIILATN